MNEILGAMIREGQVTSHVPVSMALASKSCTGIYQRMGMQVYDRSQKPRWYLAVSFGSGL